MRFTSVLLTALLMGMVTSVSNAQIVPPIGLQPGDQYRLIAPGIPVTHYLYSSPYYSYRFWEANDKAQRWADSHAVGALGATWQAVITYNSASDPVKMLAKDHTRSNPDIDGIGVPIYQTNGTRVAANYADLWDGTLETPIRYGGNGEYVRAANMYIYSNETYEPTGRTTNWFKGRGWYPRAGAPCYGMSSILTVPGDAPVNSPPTVTCPEATQFECGPASHDVTLSVALSDDDGDTLNVLWTVNGVQQQSDDVPGASDSFTHTYGLGVSVVTVTVNDGTADPVSCSTVVTVVDTTEPIAICSDDVVVDTDTGECFATNVSLGTPTVSDNCGEVTIENDAPAVFLLGTTAVTWTFTDASNNFVTCTQLVTVEDHEAPYLPILEEIAVPHTGGKCEATVTLETPEATDNCGVASTTNDAPADGVFPVGDTIVTWTATDTSGNTATTTQLVTVTNTAPVADAGIDRIVECHNVSGTGTSVTLNGTGSYDPDAGDVFSYQWSAVGIMFDDPTSATPTADFPMGATTVSLIVEDQCGAIDATDVIIVVEDTTAPQIQAVVVNRQALWPPNHNMIPIALDLLVRDTCDSPEDLLVICVVSSNEPDDGTGDGEFTGDVDGSDGYTSPVSVNLTYNADTGRWEGNLALRAERDGSNSGRVYSIECAASDLSGNSTVTTATATVNVPHSKKK